MPDVRLSPNLSGGQDLRDQARTPDREPISGDDPAMKLPDIVAAGPQRKIFEPTLHLPKADESRSDCTKGSRGRGTTWSSSVGW